MPKAQNFCDRARSVKLDRRSVIVRSSRDGNVGLLMLVLFSDDPRRWVDNEEKTK
jgi:hypothetical protein